MALLWAVTTALAITVLVLTVAVVALAREVGLLSHRLPPAPALDSGQGPEIGATLPAISGVALDGETVALTKVDGTTRVLIFLSSQCAPCMDLLNELNAIRRDWPEHQVVPVVSGPREQIEAFRERLGPPRSVVVDERGEISASLGVTATPFALTVGPEGDVKARGVVNNREMFSSLLSGHVRSGTNGIWIAASS